MDAAMISRLATLAGVAVSVALPYALCVRHDRKTVHECPECAHVMPSQRRDWHRGVQRWYTMLGEGRTWE